LCISDVDLAWARQHAPTAPSELLPCSLLLDRYDAVPSPPDDAAQICFVGGLDWVPNEVGLRWFVTEVLPKVIAAVPHATFAVLARGAAERDWLTGNPGIRIVPAESSAASLFAASRVSVAPLLSGGGVRIKIPESMALGCPVVATPIGAEGHDLPGLTRTDDPTAFAAACIRHLVQARTPESRRTMRAAVQARYGASVLAVQLIEHWVRLAGNRAKAG
jgi:glycosyltransferase involved in cell wall biosynthesis